MIEVNIPPDSFKLISALSQKHPSLKSLFDEIDSNLNQHLWYQLSENILTLSQNPELQQGNDLIEFYNGVVFFIEPTLNPMKYLAYIQNMIFNYKDKMEEALQFVENIENKHKDFKGEQKISMSHATKAMTNTRRNLFIYKLLFFRYLYILEIINLIIII